MTLKAAIPFVDLRGKTPVDLLRSYPDKARELMQCARRMYGVPSYVASLMALPIADRLSHAWLKRSRNPYLYEIESFADILNMPGAYTLNVCYEWGCTSGAWRTGDTISMLRVLDWPFPGIGRHVMVVQQSGKAGDYYNVTWPGMAGVFTGMAPGRFSASINQAPMRRHRRGFVGDWLVNRLMASRECGLPPSHLLRQVFERCENYADAKAMLERTPIAAPAIFVLAGLEPGQGCIIERLENAAEVNELSAGMQVAAANHFNSDFSTYGDGWRPREIDSMGRYRECGHIGEYDLAQPHFNWLQAPIVNGFTRLCVLSDAATRRLMVQGFEGVAQATGVFNLPAIAHESKEAV
jgi:hypothetical protein